MKILVLISIVPDIYYAVENNIIDDAVQVNDDAKDINPLDTQVLMKAFSLPDAEVSAVYVGDTECQKSLRYLVAMGVKNVFRIAAKAADAYSTAAYLADFIEKNEYDMVLCGESSWDYSSGQTPMFLSEKTGISLINDVSDVSFSGQNSVKITQKTPFFVLKMGVKTPIILVCNKDIFPQGDIRIPSMREMMMAVRVPIKIVEVAHEVAPKILYSHFQPMKQRNAVKMLNEEDLPLLVKILKGEVKGDGLVFSEGQRSLFSGRVLCDVSQDEMPMPVMCEAEGEKTPLPLHKSLKDAKVIVSGGMGCDAMAWKKIDALSSAVQAVVGCTRPVYHSGVRSYYEHVGQTGQKVAPDVYLAVGISGAIQHIGGMVRSKCIIAINSDANAPIFSYSDYGVVGDANVVLDRLLEILTKK